MLSPHIDPVCQAMSYVGELDDLSDSHTQDIHSHRIQVAWPAVVPSARGLIFDSCCTVFADIIVLFDHDGSILVQLGTRSENHLRKLR